MCGGGGGGGSGDAEKKEAQRQARIRSGLEQINSIFGGFDDSFYQGRADEFTDFAKPQLDDQFADAQEDLTFALARNNRLDSSVAAEQRADLNDKFNLERINLEDQANKVGTDSRNAVEGSRADLVALNSSVADPNQIALQANNRMAGLTASEAFNPLGPLFTNVGDTLGSQAELERRGNARFNTGLFTPSATSGGTGSGKVIN